MKFQIELGHGIFRTIQSFHFEIKISEVSCFVAMIDIVNVLRIGLMYVFAF